MRMWSVNPKVLCNQHLLGEHLEMHMFVGVLRKGHSIDGYIDNRLVNPCEIITRHDTIVGEMIKRGMNHKSPMTNADRHLIEDVMMAYEDKPLDMGDNLKELRNRCIACRHLQEVNNE